MTCYQTGDLNATKLTEHQLKTITGRCAHAADELLSASLSNQNKEQRAALWNRIADWFRNWRNRRQDRASLERMNALDDAILTDIGVSRVDIRWAMNLPASTDSLAALEMQRQQNIRAMRRF